jgi:hypothetical protein
MTKPEKLDSIIKLRRRLLPLAALLAVSAALFILGGTAKGEPGDQWILPIDHTQGSGFTTQSGAGYNGTDALEASGMDGVRRVYWALSGLSVGTGNPVPTTTELYSIEWYEPTQGGIDWQPIESQFHGAAGETWPVDASIPWAGAYGANHQYIGANTAARGTWATTGPGPQAPASDDFNAGPNGIYLWLTSGSWLYAKWDFGWSIDHTWSALRLTQQTGTYNKPVIQSVSKVGDAVMLTWSASAGIDYQVQYKTNLTQVSWDNLGGSVSGTSPTSSASDDNPPETCRFYRVIRLVPTPP